MNVPGRNDPCPCGSGKKYKKCCLPSAEASEFEYRRQRHVESGLIPRLIDFAFEVLGPTAIEDAWAEFNDYEPVEELTADSPMNMVFMPWFLFNWTHQVTREGQETFAETTIAESFLEEYEEQLTVDENLFLFSAIRSPYTLCEVIELKPGVGMKLLDLFRRFEYEVVERMASQLLKRGEIIYCATTELGQIKSNIGTSPFPLRPTEKVDVLNLRKEIVADVGQATLTEVDLHLFEADIRGLYLELLSEMLAPPQIVNTDQDPFLPQKIYFDLESVDEAFHQLKDLAGEEHEDELLLRATVEDGRVVSAEIPWVGGKAEVQKQRGGPVLLGVLKLNDGRLIAEVNSTNRAESIRTIVQERLGDHVTYKTTLLEPLEGAIEKLWEQARYEEEQGGGSFGRASAAAAGKGDAEHDSSATASPYALDLESPEVLAIMKEAAQTHWNTWFDIPVPALNDMTPREAAKTTEGRDLLESLLLYYESQSVRVSDNFLKPDIPAIRRELGME